MVHSRVTMDDMGNEVEPMSNIQLVLLVCGVGGLGVLYCHCSVSRGCTVTFSALPGVSSDETLRGCT